jgi:two-component system, sensor histidine kinase
MVVPRRVLLVDDHDDARELLEALCEHSGHQVETASTGAGGVAAAVAFQPHIAFIDIRLPDISGFEVARTLRAEMGPSCPRLVALSGFGHSEAKERASRDGFDEYVIKPIDVDALENLIRGS